MARGRQAAKSGAGEEREKARYRAPALEKGLEVLELLAKERRPLTNSMISERLGRSPSELFRMIQVLEYHGFIEQAEDGTGLVPTDKLFMLGMERTPLKSMLEYALPVMRELSNEIGQSCHLAVRSGSEIVVVARMESFEQIGFAVRIGYRRTFIFTASGTVLFAFMDEKDRQRWLERLPDTISAEQIADFTARAEKTRINGYEKIKSSFTVGVTDICAPVLRGATAAAGLTVPFVHSISPVMSINDTIKRLRAAAAQISASLLVADHRI